MTLFGRILFACNGTFAIVLLTGVIIDAAQFVTNAQHVESQSGPLSLALFIMFLLALSVANALYCLIVTPTRESK